MINEKALVLGGGGITGIAWESGVLAGLIDSGILVNHADKILGSSAGSYVGSILANGQNMKTYYEQLANNRDNADNAQLDPSLFELWREAFVQGKTDEQVIGKYLGDIINKSPSTVSFEERERSVRKRIGNVDWTPQLEITAINSKTGTLESFNETSDISLIEAVMASGAVPGIWPHVDMLGASWIDGGMISSTNARLMANYKDIIILAPLDQKQGLVPSVYEDVETLKTNSNVTLITPDQDSRNIIGTNIYSSQHIKEIGDAGYQQGKLIGRDALDELKHWQ
ncbi:patatin-like phospholipase family protein [Staphylococcus kloosii]|uniref:Patatin n=1 Tax=Staphylococcus kloosii TaxID=29384 RepID=A0ABQ0XKB5_9STAP|nr:patatin-like phospholipase family protein [Staphylococcus kloosii]AVQ34841.1 patatin-like phospholipase family protein [Staphylococcus kloosii]PNZ06585.1 phospholipase [Staphylococcus kloosii]GEP81871.1 patatin [Staphylococcus kloosii]SUM50404.1 patatin-like phospholipase family protein [Staphylococcus kloosii]